MPGAGARAREFYVDKHKAAGDVETVEIADVITTPHYHVHIVCPENVAADDVIVTGHFHAIAVRLAGIAGDGVAVT